MLLNKLVEDLQARAGISKVFQAILLTSFVVNVLLAATLLTMDRTVRTILAPPEINKSFWVDGRRLSAEYLEQMGSWVVSQFATVAPGSVEYQTQTLLKYVHPSVHGDLAVRFKRGANKLKADNISKVFMPREVRASESTGMVAFIGTQSMWVGDKRVPGDEVKAFLVQFDYDGSRTYIKTLRETNPKKPFEQPNQTGEADAEPTDLRVHEVSEAPERPTPEAVETSADTSAPSATHESQ